MPLVAQSLAEIERDQEREFAKEIGLDENVRSIYDEYM